MKVRSTSRLRDMRNLSTTLITTIDQAHAFIFYGVRLEDRFKIWWRPWRYNALSRGIGRKENTNKWEPSSRGGEPNGFFVLFAFCLGHLSFKY